MDGMNEQTERHTLKRFHLWLTAHLLERAVQIHPGEVRTVGWSFIYFFALLCGYYILRPVRDEMGIAGGTENLQWLFTGTFIAMLCASPLFAALTARYPRHFFLPLVYWFFIANILLFYTLFQSSVPTRYVAWGFFIWISVFNLFVVSVFWSFMVDLFTTEQAQRVFGFIAAGGSAGALVGPFVASLLVRVTGPVNLLPMAAGMLAVAVLSIYRLLHWTARIDMMPAATGRVRASGREEQPLGGGVFTGMQLVLRSRYLLGICLFMWLFTTLSTFLYFEQAHIIAANFVDPGQRTAVFAAIDLAVNAITIFTQLFLTSRIIARLGFPGTLGLVPALTVIGFAGLGVIPALAILVAFQVLRRAGDYAVTRPAREMLFIAVNREEKYKSKNFIDTVVYRGGDAVSGWLFAGLMALGLGLQAIAMVAVPVAVLWAAVAVYLGRAQQGRSARLS